MGDLVTFQSNGGTASGYLSSPASGTGPGVIVIQEWGGLIPQVKGAAQYLASHPKTSSGKIGVVGQCMGGMLALMTGTVAPELVGAVVDCYGIPPTKKPDYAKLKGIPVLGLFGGKDEWVMSALPALEADLKAAGVPFEK